MATRQSRSAHQNQPFDNVISRDTNRFPVKNRKYKGSKQTQSPIGSATSGQSARIIGRKSRSQMKKYDSHVQESSLFQDQFSSRSSEDSNDGGYLSPTAKAIRLLGTATGMFSVPQSNSDGPGPEIMLTDDMDSVDYGAITEIRMQTLKTLTTIEADEKRSLTNSRSSIDEMTVKHASLESEDIERRSRLGDEVPKSTEGVDEDEPCTTATGDVDDDEFFDAVHCYAGDDFHYEIHGKRFNRLFEKYLQGRSAHESTAMDSPIYTEMKEIQLDHVDTITPTGADKATPIRHIPLESVLLPHQWLGTHLATDTLVLKCILDFRTKDFEKIFSPKSLEMLQGEYVRKRYHISRKCQQAGMSYFQLYGMRAMMALHIEKRLSQLVVYKTNMSAFYTSTSAYITSLIADMQKPQHNSQHNNSKKTDRSIMYRNTASIRAPILGFLRQLQNQTKLLVENRCILNTMDSYGLLNSKDYFKNWEDIATTGVLEMRRATVSPSFLANVRKQLGIMEENCNRISMEIEEYRRKAKNTQEMIKTLERKKQSRSRLRDRFENIIVEVRRGNQSQREPEVMENVLERFYTLLNITEKRKNMVAHYETRTFEILDEMPAGLACDIIDDEGSKGNVSMFSFLPKDRSDRKLSTGFPATDAKPTSRGVLTKRRSDECTESAKN